MEFLFPLFAALGSLGLWFWVIAIAAFIIIATTVDNNRYIFTGPELLVTVALLCWITGFNPLPWVLAHPFVLLKWGAIYLGVGVIYGYIKLRIFLTSIRNSLAEFRETNELVGPLTDNQVSSFYRGIRVNEQNTIPPRISHFKKRITAWMTYWPFSLPGTLITDPIRRFFNFVYETFAKHLQNVANRQFKDMA